MRRSHAGKEPGLSRGVFQALFTLTASVSPALASARVLGIGVYNHLACSKGCDS